MSQSPVELTPHTLVGTTLADQFLIEKRIGEGGMGAVYLATQLGMDRKVVVKVMHPELTAGSANAVLRFQREARAVASLNHPHIVQVHVFGQSDTGQLYQAMEFIDGRDLGADLTRGAMKQERALLILSQIAAALADAHAAGIVHRDLKPENIMLTDRHGNADWVKVLDFGIAKLREPETGKAPTALTQAGAVFGTPAYMAPEQIRGLAVDARTDLYAIGVILHEMVTGAHPFDALSPIDFLIKHVHEAFPPPAERFPKLNLTPAVCGMIDRLLAKDPAARFQNAMELQEAIQQALAAGGFVASSSGVAGSHPMLAALSQTPPSGVAGRDDLVLSQTVTHLPDEPRPRGLSTGFFVGLGLLLAGGTVAAVLAFGSSSPIEASPETIAEAVVVEPTVAVAAVVEPAAVQVVESEAALADEAAGSDEALDLAEVGVEDEEPALTPEPMEFEGFMAPVGSTLITSTRASLRLSVPLTPAEIFAFYAEAYPDTTRPIKNGLEFTDPDFGYRSLTVGVDGVTMFVQALRRAPAATRVERLAQPLKPVQAREAKPEPERRPETRPVFVEEVAAEVVAAPEPPIIAQPTPTPPPIIIQKPGTLPTEIQLPDGTVLPTGVPDKRERSRDRDEEVDRAVKETGKAIKDAVRKRGGSFIRGLGL